MSVTVPTMTDFNALAAKVGLLTTSLATLTTQYNALATAVGQDELRISTIEIAEAAEASVGPPVVPPIISPPTPLSGLHEPSGFTMWTDRSFDQVISGGWGAQAENAGPIVIVQDPTAPISPPNVGQITYPAGFTGGGYAPAQAWKSGLLAMAWTQLYVRFGVKFSANWESHPESGVNKIGFVWMHGQPILYFGGQGDSLQPQIRIQGTGEGARNLIPNISGMARGQWHVWEAYLKGNTPGVKDGIARWWLDGALVGDYSDVMWAGAGQVNVWGELQDSVSWFPIWGGIGSTPLAAEQYQWLDHYYVSGAP